MKSSKYSVFCHKILGKNITKRYSKKILKRKNLVLEKANISMVYDEYLSFVLFNIIITFFASLLFGGIFLFIFWSMNTFLLFCGLIICIPLLVWQFFNYYPKYLINKRGENIDRLLPYAVNFISTMAVAGVSPIEIFRSLSEIGSYGELQIESKKIVKRIDGMGINNISALKHAIDVSPSKKFKSFLQGMIGVIQSGSELSVYLHNIVDGYLESEFISRKKNLEMLSVVAEIFVISIVAFPLFLVIIMSVMSFMTGPPNFTVDTLNIFSFLVLPMAYAGFYLLIKSVSFEEVKRFRWQKKSLIERIIKENRKVFFVIIICLFIIIAFIFVIFSLDGFGIIEIENYLLDVVFISILIFIGPVGFYNANISNRKTEIHERLSDFFVEIGNSVSSGLTVFDAVYSASKGNYGELTDEIEKMNAEISWRFSIDQVFDNFVNRVQSGIVQRIFLTINKGLKMGGKTEKVFIAAAKEMKQVNRIEEQKKANMSIYTVVVLMSFFIFLAIIYILNTTLFSTFFETSNLSIAATPNSVNDVLKLGTVNPIMFKNALYSFVFVQGFGTGLLGGFMMDGNLSCGVRYSFILGIITIVVFKVMIL